MKYISVSEYAFQHGVSERTVRNYYTNIPEFLRDTCLTAQDNFKAIMKYFRIEE